MKKIIIALLCLAVIVSAVFVTAYLKENTDNGEQTQTTITTTQTIANESRSVYLGYFEGKSFNPFKTNSPTNLAISTLLYDSLFVLNDDWSSTAVIATSIDIKDKQITVKLVDGAVFSNGASLTAYDVVYSFNLAKKSNNYKARLTNVTAAMAGVDTVTFTLASPDIYIQQCLTFPIVQNGTGTAALPVGSGRYVLRNVSGEYVLSANTANTRNEALTIQAIGLVPITAQKDELYRIQTGKLTYFYDDMENGSFRKLNAATVSVPTNNLIYLAYNSSKENFANKQVINALRLAIDKNTLADTVFDNLCSITDMPFNPSWFVLDGLQTPTLEYNLIQAGNILDDNGIVYSASDKNYRYDSDGVFEITILVNKESTVKVNCAKFIGKNLKSLGAKVTVSALEFKEYQQALKDGDYDLYIGEVKLSPNMDLSAFFKAGSSLSYGISSETVSNAYNDFKSGNIDIGTFINVFEEEKPFIPICYRTSVAYYSNEITFEGTVGENDLFKNIYTWKKQVK